MKPQRETCGLHKQTAPTVVAATTGLLRAARSAGRRVPAPKIKTKKSRASTSPRSAPWRQTGRHQPSVVRREPEQTKMPKSGQVAQAVLGLFKSPHAYRACVGQARPRLCAVERR